MKEEKIVVKNAVLNVVKTISSITIPVITYMYVTRVFGVEGYGRISFSKAFVANFSFVAMLGIVPYSTREASKLRNNRSRLNVFFSEVFLINMISAIVALGLCILLAVRIDKFSNYRLVIVIYSVGLVFQAMGIEWLYVAMEEFKYITIRTTVAQIIALILVIVLVKDAEHIYLYAVIQTMAIVIPNILNFVMASRFVSLKRISVDNLGKHLEPVLSFFLMLLFINIFRQLDTIMLGMMHDERVVGLYSAGDKMSSMLTSILGAIPAVIFPRLSSRSEGINNDEVKKLTKDFFDVILMLAIPLTIGLILYAEPVVHIFCGKDFSDAIITTRILSLRILLSSINAFFVVNIFVSLGIEKNSIIATGGAAFLDFLLNLFLIPKMFQNGAAVSTVVAEIIEFFIILFLLKKQGFNLVILKSGLRYLLASMTVIIVFFFAQLFESSQIIELIVAVFLSIVVYFGSLYVIEDRLVREFLNKIRS